MEKYVVTINRQFGSLGRPIARKMSEILGVEYYDRDIVDSVAKETKMPVSRISEEEETAKTSFFSMKYPLGHGTTSVQDNIFEAQRRIISKLADTQNCIIVGRCSDYVLRNHPRLFRIFIYAPFEARYRNCVENLHMDPAEAQKMKSTKHVPLTISDMPNMLQMIFSITNCSSIAVFLELTELPSIYPNSFYSDYLFHKYSKKGAEATCTQLLFLTQKLHTSLCCKVLNLTFLPEMRIIQLKSAFSAMRIFQFYITLTISLKPFQQSHYVTN